jgi:hypothetical protein
MSQSCIFIAGGTFAVGTMLGLFWPDYFPADAGKTIARAELSESTSASANGLNEEPSSGNVTSKSAADFTERLKTATETCNGLKRSRAVAAIADGLDVRQVREALEAVDRIHIPESDAIRLQLVSRWAELEPNAAFAYAREKKDDFALGPIMKVWASSYLASAQAAIAKMPESVARRAAIGGVIEGLSETDPKQAFELAQKSDTFPNVTDKVFENWVEKDPQEAASHLTQLGPEFDRRSAICTIATNWADTDLPSALQWAESLPENDAKVNGSYTFRTPMSFVIANWMDRDPDAALRWLENRPIDSRTTSLLTAVSAEIATSIDDPMLSAKVALMLPPGRARTNALNTLTAWWRQTDFEGALDWAEQQSDDVRATMFPLLAGVLGNQDPAYVARYATRLGDSVRPATVLASWASKDPVAAAEWIRTQPPNAEQLHELAAVWLLRDAKAATEWINTVENGETKDRALSDLTEQLAAGAPELAVGWIAGISDEEIRNKAYRNALERWLRVDSSAARKWLSTAPVAEDLKTKWLRSSTQ